MHWAVNSAGECYLHTVEVTGSIPVPPTNGIEDRLNKGDINPNGGAIALGHPLGCTGAKLTAQLLHELKRRKAKRGIVSMCIGGGMGAAGIYEML